MAESGISSARVLNVAEGVSVELWRLEPAEELVVRTATGPDGRAHGALPPPAAFVPGRYELSFGVSDYFHRRGLGADPPFHDVVPVRIFLADGQGRYHVPLLCSPWSYTTCRGP